MSPSLGTLVQLERESRGWSREQLARRACVTPVTVWRIERDAVSPRGDVLAGLLLALDPPPGALRKFLRAAQASVRRAA
jgi:transcriptional regulator with XRE-family HTH domain